jgi:hypothetical protein
VVHVVVVGYIIYHYFLRFDRGVVHVVVILSTITVLKFERRVVHVVIILSIDNVLGLTEEWFMLLLFVLLLLFKGGQRSGSCFGCYIVYHYCLRFYRGVVHVVVVLILSNIAG